MTNWTLWVSTVGVGSFVALVAYHLGRRVGRTEGSRLSARRVPVQLRHQAISTGVCPICDTKHAAWYNVPKEVVE